MSNITILVEIEILPEESGFIHEALSILQQDSKKEPGLEYMHVMRNNDNPAQIIIIEAWKSEQDFERHIASKHFFVFGESMKKSATSMAITKLLRLE